jgi:dihydroflavonol-4-reductase
VRALVIGASGAIGGNVVRALVEGGHEVRALVRDDSSTKVIDGVRCERVIGDVRDQSSIEAAARGRDWVFHCAGYYPTVSLEPRKILRTGVEGMRHVLDACSHARVVYTSSLSTIGEPFHGRIANEDDLYVPGTVADPYYEVKWAMEMEATRAAAAGRDVVIVNPSICIGAWDPKPTGGRLVLLAGRGKMGVYVEGTINVVHLADCGLGHVRAAERGRSGRRYILGGEDTKISSVLKLAADLCGVAPPRRAVPGKLALGAAYATEVLATFVTKRPPLLPMEGVNMILHGQALSTRRMRDELGITPRPLATSVGDAVSWFREHGYIR